MDQEWCGQQEQGSDSSPVLGTGRAALQVLCPVLGPHNMEEHGGAGACPEKGNKAGEASGTQVLSGAAERAGDVCPGEEEAQGRPHHSLNSLPGLCSWGGLGSSPVE